MGLRAPAAIPQNDREFSRWCRETEVDYIFRGNGSPEGIVTAAVGCLYLRRDGGTSTVLYVKESGTGNTGWVAK